MRAPQSFDQAVDSSVSRDWTKSNEKRNLFSQQADRMATR